MSMKSFPSRKAVANASFRQRGVVLLIALVVLVAMTLSALALIKSVNMTNLISGNLAFRESAVLYAERATEHAIAWLVEKADHSPSTLFHDDGGGGYLAVRKDPATGKSWEDLWRDSLQDHAISLPVVGGGETDPTGNRVEYVIQRLCEETGTPANDKAKCGKPPHEAAGGTSSVGIPSLGLTNPQIYYRVTARVKGPRNTVVYTQMIIAL